MRYYYKAPAVYYAQYGQTYICDHPVYNRCTLYKIGDKGLAVIQQRFDAESKSTYWTEIDDCLVDDLYLNKGFLNYFNKYAAKERKGLYPTVTIRQIMWALRFCPLQRKIWETVFDKAPI